MNLVLLWGLCDGFGRSGLTSRTVYEINMFGHGLVVCGDTEAPPEPKEALDVEAAGTVEVPVMMCGFSSRERTLAGLDPTQYGPLAERAVSALCNEPGASVMLRRAGAPAELGAPLTFFPDRVALPGAKRTGPALVVVRNPARIPLERERRANVHGEVRAITERLRALGHADVRLLCQDASDFAFAAAYGDLPYLYTSDPYPWLSALRDAPVVVSYRLEATTACAGYGVPVVHLAADDAARAILMSLGLDEWCVDLRVVQEPVTAVGMHLADLPRQSARRVELLGDWGVVDRRIGGAFERFARAVLEHRDKELNLRRENAGLEAKPKSFLKPQETTIDMKLSDLVPKPE